MTSPTAAKIMGTRNYFARMKTTGKSSMYRQVDWMNTNKLLWKKGYIAGKTGHTIKAGGCLASVYRHDGEDYFVVVLGCRGTEDRFRETEILVNKYILMKTS
jgi:D-alanyl-D-alanine carboxypeptidase